MNVPKPDNIIIIPYGIGSVIISLKTVNNIVLEYIVLLNIRFIMFSRIAKIHTIISE